MAAGAAKAGAAKAARRPRANSAVARDVEALVERSFPLIGPYYPETSPYVKQRAKIVGHGFEALPVLAEYVDDPRWTRTLQPRCASAAAAVKPAKPAPAISACRCFAILSPAIAFAIPGHYIANRRARQTRIASGRNSGEA